MNGVLIDEAFKLFHDKKYKEAIASFDQLLGNEETPSWVKSRVQTYKTVADRAISGPAEEEISPALVSYYMNLRDYARAEEVLGQTDMTEGDKAFYQAHIHIEQGRRTEAIACLKIAIREKNNRGFAINSPSFAAYLKDEDFLFLQIHENE